MTQTELRKLMPVGTIFEAVFIKTNSRTTRLVKKQSYREMVSEILTGPKKGELCYLSWVGVKCVQDESKITLSDDFGAFVEYYLKPIEVS